ncbi:hypothetical protein BDQ17DRAFT_1361067 [Cyathus striatus]|nr:hypothetical protein BDQ17DRAFT_1361067 [Cyathus striatus]
MSLDLLDQSDPSNYRTYHGGSGGSFAVKAFYKLCSPAAIFDSEERGPTTKCLEGTAQTSLNRIRGWSNNNNGPPILWLSGPVGSGKSSIAQTMAEEWAGQKRVIATFFFSSQIQGTYTKPSKWASWRRKIFNFGRKGNEISEEKNDRIPLILTLAYQLARHVISTIRRDPSILDAVMWKQFNELILHPLQDLPPTPHPLIILVDALDECRNVQAQMDFLKIISSFALSATTRGVKFFVSSRQENHINILMRKIYVAECLEIVSLERTSETDSDIAKYLEKEFSSIQENTPTFRYDGSTISELVDRSSGQFIFASTIAKYVGETKENPRLQLDHVVGSSLSHSSARPGSGPRTLTYLLGFILSSGGELSLPELDKLCSLQEGDSIVKLRPLHSLLRMPGDTSESGIENTRIQILHASFEEFLTNPARSHQFYVDSYKIHAEIISSWLGKEITRLYRIPVEGQGPIALIDAEAIPEIPEQLSKDRSVQSMSPIFFVLYSVQQIRPLSFVWVILRFWIEVFRYHFYHWGRLKSLVFSRYFVVMSIIIWPMVIWTIITAFITRFICSKLLPFMYCIPGAATFGLFILFPWSAGCRTLANVMAILYVSVIFTTPLLLLFSHVTGILMLPIPLEFVKIWISAFAVILWFQPILESPILQVLEKLADFIRNTVLPKFRAWWGGSSQVDVAMDNSV